MRLMSSPNSASRARTASVRASRVSGSDIAIDTSGARAAVLSQPTRRLAASVAVRTVPVASSAAMPSAVETVARSASPAAMRSDVVMRVSGLFGRKMIAMRLITANGTAIRNECAMPWA